MEGVYLQKLFNANAENRALAEGPQGSTWQPCIAFGKIEGTKISWE